MYIKEFTVTSGKIVVCGFLLIVEDSHTFLFNRYITTICSTTMANSTIISTKSAINIIRNRFICLFCFLCLLNLSFVKNL